MGIMIIVRAEVVRITAVLTSVELMKRSEANVMSFNFYNVLIKAPVQISESK